MDLVEAAIRTGRDAEAAAHVQAMQDAHVGVISSRLALNVAGAAAMVAPDDEAGGLFASALAVPEADMWPFDLARVHLLYGESLRRARSNTQARAHLSAALDIFRRLGARPWQIRAGHELRATGLALQGADRGSFGGDGLLGMASLAPLDREIVRLAAAGLTNKQVGERLYISHRTVAAHLYQLFPRLGITSRAALRDALDALETSDPGD